MSKLTDEKHRNLRGTNNKTKKVLTTVLSKFFETYSSSTISNKNKISESTSEVQLNTTSEYHDRFGNEPCTSASTVKSINNSLEVAAQTISKTKHSKKKNNNLITEFLERNTNNDTSILDFQSPKKLKTVRNHEPVSKKIKKPKKRSKIQKTQTCDKFFLKAVVAHSTQDGVDADELQMALALSRSMQSDDVINIEDKENPKTTAADFLKQFGFKKQCTTDNNKKKRKNKYTPLTNRNPEIQRKKLQKNIDTILNACDYNNDEFLEHSNNDELYNVCSAYLLRLNVPEKYLFTLNSAQKETEKYYTNNLVEVSTVKCGYLLKDWSLIPGRDASPKRQTKLDVSDAQHIEVSPSVSLLSDLNEEEKELGINNEYEPKLLCSSINARLSIKKQSDSKNSVRPHKNNKRPTSPDIFAESFESQCSFDTSNLSSTSRTDISFPSSLEELVKSDSDIELIENEEETNSNNSNGNISSSDSYSDLEIMSTASKTEQELEEERLIAKYMTENNTLVNENDQRIKNSSDRNVIVVHADVHEIPSSADTIISVSPKPLSFVPHLNEYELSNGNAIDEVQKIDEDVVILNDSKRKRREDSESSYEDQSESSTSNIGSANKTYCNKTTRKRRNYMLSPTSPGQINTTNSEESLPKDKSIEISDSNSSLAGFVCRLQTSLKPKSVEISDSDSSDIVQECNQSLTKTNISNDKISCVKSLEFISGAYDEGLVNEENVNDLSLNSSKISDNEVNYSMILSKNHFENSSPNEQRSQCSNINGDTVEMTQEIENDRSKLFETFASIDLDINNIEISQNRNNTAITQDKSDLIKSHSRESLNNKESHEISDSDDENQNNIRLQAHQKKRLSTPKKIDSTKSPTKLSLNNSEWDEISDSDVEYNKMLQTHFTKRLSTPKKLDLTKSSTKRSLNNNKLHESSDSDDEYDRNLQTRRQITPKRVSTPKKTPHHSTALKSVVKKVVYVSDSEHESYPKTPNTLREISCSPLMLHVTESEDEYDAMVQQVAPQIRKSFNKNATSPININVSSIDKVCTEDSIFNISYKNKSYTIKTGALVSPKLDYASMDSPTRIEHLKKWGLKPQLSKTQAVRCLDAFYNERHPFIEFNVTKNSETNGHSSPIANTATTTSSKPNKKNSLNEKQPKINLNFPTFKNDDNETIYLPSYPRTKKPWCLQPLHIAWYNLLKSDKTLYEHILQYEPFYLKDIRQRFKELGLLYNMNDLIGFFDKHCITFRTEMKN